MISALFSELTIGSASVSAAVPASVPASVSASVSTNGSVPEFVERKSAGSFELVCASWHNPRSRKGRSIRPFFVSSFDGSYRCETIAVRAFRYETRKN
jgi:hypothetical protein